MFLSQFNAEPILKTHFTDMYLNTEDFCLLAVQRGAFHTKLL
jgi:hypothetical protein